MKDMLKTFLAVLARLTLKRYTPRVIGITGNAGKTGTKEAVYAMVSAKFRARRGEKSFNNEFGVPLTILGITHPGKSALRWFFALLLACARLVWTRYPDVLVLEMGVDTPGDMEYLLSVVCPDIAVFTSMGDIPVHVERFAHREELIQEKLKLGYETAKKGTVIINADVRAWSPLEKSTHVMTYGFANEVDVKIHKPEYRMPAGITFKLEHKGSIVPFRLDGTMGLEPGAYAAAAACAVGLSLGMNLVEISSALTRYRHPKGRLCMLDGLKGSFVLDDTYNASPSSTDVALSALAAIPAKRKIAALGDMLELGQFSEEAHREAGRKATKICDVLMTVGTRMRFAADEAAAHGFRRNENLFSFDTSEDAGEALAKTIREGDLVLVKGSQGMRMEKAVKVVMAHPEKAKDLLVRQEKSWLKM